MKLKSLTPFFSYILAIFILSGLIFSNPRTTLGLSEQTNIIAKATLKNLIAAYNSDLFASDKYLAFAVKADEEGYFKVGQLFRASANSALVRAQLNAKLITQQGGTPKLNKNSYALRITKANLHAAIETERLNIDKYYPEYLDRSKIDNLDSIFVSFAQAIKVKKHGRSLYEKALNNLDYWRTASKGFFVCQDCGNMAENLDYKECPVCGCDLSRYKNIT